MACHGQLLAGFTEGGLPVLVASIAPLFDSSGWYYYLLCAVLFCLSGLLSGYFIWRKGRLQMLDAENEARRTRLELDSVREDTLAEEKGLLKGGGTSPETEVADPQPGTSD